MGWESSPGGLGRLPVSWREFARPVRSQEFANGLARVRQACEVCESSRVSWREFARPVRSARVRLVGWRESVRPVRSARPHRSLRRLPVENQRYRFELVRTAGRLAVRRK